MKKSDFLEAVKLNADIEKLKSLYDFISANMNDGLCLTDRQITKSHIVDFELLKSLQTSIYHLQQQKQAEFNKL